ncbi:MAG: 2-C-methyl-D-erythritol 4-phosphate cytidylyltransferase, partial [bacterium]
TQTPQGFHLSPYWQATLKSQREDWDVTDDASLLEKAGIPVHLIPGEETNLKITTPLDLEFARFLSNHSLNN